MSEEKASLTLQIIYIAGIWVITLIFGFFPLLFKVCKNSAQFVGVANAFSGGIFLGIGLFHLLPESGESFDEYWKSNPGSAYEKLPSSYFLTFISYATILLMEKVFFNAHSLVEHGHAHEHGINGGHEHSDEENPEIRPIEGLTEENKQFDEKKEIQANVKKVDLCVSLPNRKKIPNLSRIYTENDESFRFAISNKNRFVSFIQVRDIHSCPVSDFRASCEKVDGSFSKKVNCILDNTKRKEPCSNGLINQEGKEQSDINGTTNYEHQHQHSTVFTSKWTPYVLLIALGFHGFFEGIALGVQKSNTFALFFFIAIIAHKWAEAFTLGTAFHKANIEKCTYFGLIILFSFITPAGDTLGLCFAGTSKLVEGIFLALSAGIHLLILGTFLYVSASEVIVEEFSLSQNKWWKYFVFIIGAFITAILKVIEDENTG